MRILTTSLLACVASVALVGAAVAQTPSSHTMTVQLPDGSVEQIQYTGTVAPRVAFLPPAPGFDDAALWSFGPGSPFAAMERISAEMSREADAMMARAVAMTARPMAGPEGLFQVDTAGLPRGAESYTYVATENGSGVCSRSIEMISRGPGQKPEIVSHASGDCGAGVSSATPTMLPNAQPAPESSGHLLSAQATAPHAHDGLIREAAWQPQE